MTNQEHIKISASDNDSISIRVHNINLNYEITPTDNGFELPLDGVKDFIKSLNSVYAYAIIKGA